MTDHPIELTDEASKVRAAMAGMGWDYEGGGPYPYTPTMRFIRGRERLTITLSATVSNEGAEHAV